MRELHPDAVTLVKAATAMEEACQLLQSQAGNPWMANVLQELGQLTIQVQDAASEIEAGEPMEDLEAWAVPGAPELSNQVLCAACAEKRSPNYQYEMNNQGYPQVAVPLYVCFDCKQEIPRRQAPLPELVWV